MGTKRGVATLTESGWTILESAGPKGNYIEDLEIDIFGNIWCATGTRGTGAQGAMIGILKFDGVSWSLVARPTIQSNNIYCIDSDPNDGRVWAGVWIGGLTVYNPSSGTWTPRNDLLESSVVADVYVDDSGRLAIAEYISGDAGGLAVVCEGEEVIRYSRDDVNPCVETRCPTALGPGPGGTIFVGTYIEPDVGCDAKVVQLDMGADCLDKSDDRCNKWSPFEGWLQGVAYDFALDDYGVVWLGTSAGLSSFDGTWHEVTSELGAVWDIEIDGYGTKWVGGDNGLMALYGFGVEWDDFADKRFTYNSENSPLEDAPVKALGVDADGAIWIGTGGGGIHRLVPPAPQIRERAWVDVYPNPYVESRSDEIRFSGALRGSRVRIYTMAGDLVADLDTGSAWTKQQMEDKSIVSGVYIYHAYAEDGREFVGRLVVVR
jgi:hypothetical protein